MGAAVSIGIEGQLMSYGYWGREKQRETRAVDEKAYRRQDLAPWDARWHELSVQARSFFVTEVKGPAKPQKPASQPPSVSVDAFPPHILKELTDAGFIEVQPARSRAFGDRVIAPAVLYDFASRLRTVRRLHLLNADLPSEFAKYVDHAFIGAMLLGILPNILRTVGIEDYVQIEQVLGRYVTRHRWPGWVARTLKDPLADRILDVLREAGGPIPLAELPGRIEGSKPDEVRAVLDKLVSRLVLVEDLDPKTWELMVGFLPSVREELIRAGRPGERPPLSVCERPREIGLDDSMIVNDLRAVLLEVVSEPPRLRQDQSLFQKEIERFLAALEPLPAWFLETQKWSNEIRLAQAMVWARALQMVKEEREGNQLRLQVTSKGQKWLSAGLDEQYAKIYDFLRNPAKRDNDPYSTHERLFLSHLEPYSVYGPNDIRFLGAHAAALRLEKGKPPTYYWVPKSEDIQALRESLDKALGVLQPGVFYRLDSVAAHLAFGEHNPLNLGLAPDEVTVSWTSRPVPALEEHREETGRLLIDAFIRRRLIPLGGVRAAIDDEGKICVAREPLLDAYFGREFALAERAPTPEAAARVVVQPDFSVIVIGLNPAPAAELAPFCERTTRGGTPGALILKITRESVVKAVSNGLKPAEIVARLERHASNEVPANVLHEVRDWSNWVRQVTSSTLAVLRCPDRDTADRVMGALKRQAERVNDTLVAVDQKKLTTAERTKLRGHGIIVQGESEAQGGKSRAKKKGKVW
jgi:hypothetical protein